MNQLTKILTAVFMAVAIIPLLGLAMQPEPVPLDPEWLLVSDKPYIEAANDAAEAADEWQAEQDALAEHEAAYYEPVYYAPIYNSYWYESDDEEAEADAKEWIAWRESGGDYDARNGQYIGKFQLSEDKLDGDYSPEHQEEVAEAYVADRYGSWEAAREFWIEHNWY